MTRTTVLGTIVAVGASSVLAAGFQQAPGRAPLPQPLKVKDNLYILEAASPVDRSLFTGGNVGIFITDAGVVLVDTKLAGYGPDILARVRSVTTKPVTTIINTHTHGDHNGSNEGFPASVEIIAHANTKANMEKMDAFKGEKAQFLPDRTYTDKLSFGGGKDRVDLYYFGAGHTNGDTWIVYPALRVLQTGDMFPWKDAPLLDRANGGSGVELPKSLARAVATIKDVDTVIPGHMAVTTPAALDEFQRFNADLLSGAEAAKKAGKSAADAAAGLNLKAKYPSYQTERVAAAVTAIYAELDAK